jgi:hypothetical protein
MSDDLIKMSFQELYELYTNCQRQGLGDLVDEIGKVIAYKARKEKQE